MYLVQSKESKGSDVGKANTMGSKHFYLSE